MPTDSELAASLVRDAGVLAAQMMAIGNPALTSRLIDYKQKLADKVEAAAKKMAE